MMLADKNALISIVVPVYGVEQFLDQCVQSLVTQSYSNLEIILVDDGSKDKCPQICDKWAEKDHRIKVIHKPNGGLSDARNAGIKNARGSYIAFVDSDDWIEKSFVEKLYNSMISSKSEIAECSVNIVDERGTKQKIRKAADSETLDKISALKKLIQENGIYQTVWNKIYKTDLINDLMFEVGKLHEDEFWTYKVLDRIHKISIVPDALYNYRQRQSSIMGQGYNKSRLVGLQAKYERSVYLSKYTELKYICNNQLMLECLWNLQSVLRTYSGNERDQMIKEILLVVNSIPKTNIGESMNIKNRFWIHLFRQAPVLTAEIRNKLRIGL